MLGLWDTHRTLPLLEQTAAFGERRQQVLAGNLANIDTPAYRTRDLPVKKFNEALREQITGRSQSKPLSPSSPISPGQTTTVKSIPRELYQAHEISDGSQSFQDGNNRSIERELTEMTKNVMLQQFSIELMTAQTNLLHAVISERP